MAEAKQIDQWNHTATVICWIIKVNAGKKARKLEPKHIHPFGTRKSAKRRMTREEMKSRFNRWVGVKEVARNRPNKNDGARKVEPDRHGSHDDGR
jgi:hypothetical protein